MWPRSARGEGHKNSTSMGQYQARQRTSFGEPATRNPLTRNPSEAGELRTQNCFFARPVSPVLIRVVALTRQEAIGLGHVVPVHPEADHSNVGDASHARRPQASQLTPNAMRAQVLVLSHRGIRAMCRGQVELLPRADAAHGPPQPAHDSSCGTLDASRYDVHQRPPTPADSYVADGERRICHNPRGIGSLLRCVGSASTEGSCSGPSLTSRDHAVQRSGRHLRHR